jgi:non-ribosomal peptide synthetase component E (peptide arylation enzyme)
MLFNRFKDVAEKYAHRSALNNLSYGELLALVESDSGGDSVLIDILRASRMKTTVVVPPLNVNDIVPFDNSVDEFSLVLWSSGSSGTRKPIVLTEVMLLSNADNAIECNGITAKDVVYTVCSMRHTGGINAQSLPALLAGAHVVVEPFNAFTFFNRINEIGATITHVVPRMIEVLRKVERKGAPTLKTVMCGSDCISADDVRYFTHLDCDFILNYGLTEAGPIIINHRFKLGDDLSIFKYGVPLGTKAWCRTALIGSQLALLGDCVQDGSLLTGDCVYMRNEWYIYRGRVSAGCQIIPKAY